MSLGRSELPTPPPPEKEEQARVFRAKRAGEWRMAERRRGVGWGRDIICEAQCKMKMQTPVQMRNFQPARAGPGVTAGLVCPGGQPCVRTGAER